MYGQNIFVTFGKCKTISRCGKCICQKLHPLKQGILSGEEVT